MQTMKVVRQCLIFVAALPSLAYAHTAAQAAPKTIVANIDTTRVSAPISRYEYGMFIEHIGSLIYRSLWSEMLDDRKFYFPITSKEPSPPARRGGGFPGMQLRRWRPMGPDEVVAMDKEHPFVGDQSPRIELDASVPHGIRQSSLALVKGKKYTGRIYLRGTPGAKVNVSLVWGEGAKSRQTIPFAALSDVYTKFPLRFTANADTAEGALEITGTGHGSFHIGAVSLMPADNVQGFRPDTTALLRQLHSGFGGYPAAISFPTGAGTTLSEISTSARPCLTMPGTPCSPTTSAWTSL